MDFKRTLVKRFAQVEESESVESRFWRKFRFPVVSKHPQAVSHIDASPAAPHDYAVTNGMQVTLYDGRSNKEKRVLSRFKDPVYGAVYRGDGKLLAAGTDAGSVCILDAGSRNILRTLKGHSSAARTVRFTGPAGVQVVSAGDDASLRYWDLATGDCISSISGAHGDYIRSSAARGSGLLGGCIVATGSYDHTVRLWDLRALAGSDGSSGGGGAGGQGVLGETNEEEDEGEEDDDEVDDEEEDDSDDEGEGNEDEEEEEEDDEEMGRHGDGSVADGAKRAGGGGGSSGSGGSVGSGGGLNKPGAPKGCILTVDHGEPVTAVLLAGSTVISVGGQTCKVWDILNSGRLLHTVTSHTKLVTAACVDGSGARLLTAGLDGLVKVHSMGTFAVCHTARFTGQLLALSVPADNSRMLVGAVDGTLWVKQRAMTMGDALLERKESGLLRGGGYRYFLRGRGSSAGPEDFAAHSLSNGQVLAGGGGASVAASSALPAALDFPEASALAFGAVGRGGKKVRLRPYDRALQAFDHGGALDAALETESPGVIAAVLGELATRGALQGALRGRARVETLEPLLNFLARYIAHPRYAGLCVQVVECIAQVFAGEMEARGGGGGVSAGGEGGLSPLLETRFARIRAAIGAELDLGENLFKLQGQLDVLLSTAAAGQQ